MARRTLGLILLITILCTLCDDAFAAGECPQNYPKWDGLRGVNVNLGAVTFDDLIELKKSGVSLLRVSFVDKKIMRKIPPYEISDGAEKKIEKVSGWARSLGLYIVIDPHTFVGFARDTTTSPKDAFWHDDQYQDIFVRVWGSLAQRLSQFSPNVIGYDLLNEPFPPGWGAAASENWNKIAERAVYEIRKHDKCTYIVLEAPGLKDSIGRYVPRIENAKYIKVDDPENRVVISAHFYLPFSFTHQGTAGHRLGVKFPGKIDGEFWSTDKIRSSLRDLRDFQAVSDYPIFIGEFGADAYTGDNGGAQYISDLTAIFNEYGWAWCAHIYGGADAWNIKKDLAASNGRTVTETGGTRTRWNALVGNLKKN